MKAIVFDQIGQPDQVLKVREVPVPKPGRGEVLVRMIASPVNPSDILYIQGNYGLKPTLPATPGFEGVGVVESSGGGLLGMFRKGKRVAVLNDRIGNWAEYTVTTARQVIPIPADLTDEQAASFAINPFTALALTRSVLNVPAGETLLQSAAGSALGKMVIKLGKLHGFKTINVVRRREQIEELKKLGADVVLCQDDGPIQDQVARLTNGAGVKYAIDPVGGAVGTQVVQSLALGGHAVLYGLLSGEPIQVDPRFLIIGSKRVEGFWLGDWAKKQRIVRMLRMIREVRELLRTGVLQTEVAQSYSMEQCQQAVSHAMQPGKSGKVLIKLGESASKIA